jgi:hypothetical protein
MTGAYGAGHLFYLYNAKAPFGAFAFVQRRASVCAHFARSLEQSINILHHRANLILGSHTVINSQYKTK